jgi:hypothetical protein
MAIGWFKTHVGNEPHKRRWNLAKNSNSNLFAIAINNGLLKQGFLEQNNFAFKPTHN